MLYKYKNGIDHLEYTEVYSMRIEAHPLTTKLKSDELLSFDFLVDVSILVVKLVTFYCNFVIRKV